MPLPAADLPPPLRTAPSLADAIFAPPLDRTMVYRQEVRRDDGKALFRLALVRQVRFTEQGAGYRAELTLRSAESEGAAGKRALAGLAPFIDVTMIFHLDPRGSVTGIESLDPLWTRFCEGLAAQATGDATQREIARATLAALRNAPAAERRRLFADMIAPLLAPDIAAAGVTPDQPVEAQGDTASAAGAVLKGERRVWRESGALVAETRLSGDAPIGADAGAGAVHILRVVRRTVDPHSGLVTTSRETTRRESADGTIVQTMSTRLE
ncbi:hypothetical protein [Stakelama pacifica]|nr:hypothetical protein [Stakelama pacifica]GGO99160.1 hypothetical protein GCM10011329_32010 [Stakelama pacifica]